MPMLLLDPRDIAAVRATRDGDRYEEVWNGVVVMSPLPNTEHQDLVGGIYYALRECVARGRLGRALPGVNVSDRAAGWTHNFRAPDAVVYLHGNPAQNLNTHWVGGPDFAVEIISPGEEPMAKFDFYAAVNTREVFIVERDPWALELFQLRGGVLVSAGRVDLANAASVASGVLPLAFRLVAGEERPQIEMAHTGDGRVWLA